jgi:hypothetical protein
LFSPLNPLVKTSLCISLVHIRTMSKYTLLNYKDGIVHNLPTSKYRLL